MRLNQVTVSVRDVEAAKAFYIALGLRLIVDHPPSYARFECPDGDATFSLEVGETPIGGTVVYFECDELDAQVERLHASGIHFDSLPMDQPWLWREARLRDPSGNPVCLYRAGSNRLNPPWRVEGHHA